jgi:hypothetical protein
MSHVLLIDGPAKGWEIASALFRSGVAYIAIPPPQTPLTLCAGPAEPPARPRTTIYSLTNGEDGTATFDRWSDEPGPITALDMAIENAPDADVLKLLDDVARLSRNP